MNLVKEYINFPRDPDTLSIVECMETCLGFEHKDVAEISDSELAEYINKLTMLLIEDRINL